MSEYYENTEVKKQIDFHLQEIAAIECTLGRDSSLDEKKNAKEKQTKLHYKIKELDEDFFNVISANELQKRTPSILEWMKRFSIFNF